jgi:hypothetical protein
VDILQAIINALGALIGFFLNLLPDSPFQQQQFEGLEMLFGYVNWFVPVGDIIVFMGVYLSAVAVWYGVRWVLRFVRYVK